MESESDDIETSDDEEFDVRKFTSCIFLLMSFV